MATLKQRLHRKNGSTYDVVHLETESNVVMRPSGNTVETDLKNYLPKVQNSDDVPQGLTSGQIVIGQSKGYYCTGDGEVREFGKGGGGVPVIGVDFEWSGDIRTYQIINDNDGNWRIKFLSSGTFTPLRDMTIDVFLVGGGGGGANGGIANVTGGGGGGYTKTVKSVQITANTEYNIVVGAGGTATNDGGDSTAFEKTAKGGYAATGSANNAKGGNGGSGGGVGTYEGGIDGANAARGGTGQGTTTREFRESTGDLYATGGGGSDSSTAEKNGAPNTGDGGSGSRTVNAGEGGSGIVVIRKHKG